MGKPPKARFAGHFASSLTAVSLNAVPLDVSIAFFMSESMHPLNDLTVYSTCHDPLEESLSPPPQTEV